MCEVRLEARGMHVGCALELRRIRTTIHGVVRDRSAGRAGHTGAKEKTAKGCAMKRRTTTTAGIACGAVCAVCVLAFTQGVRAEADAARSEALARYGGEQIEVCVATRDIAAGEAVDASCMETRLWVADLLPAEAVRSAEEVSGKAASSAILAGEVLSMRRFQGVEGRVEVPEGLAAVSVPAKDVQAVGGAVRAGERVDMYATGGTSTDLLASDVLVLATSASTDDAASDAQVSWVTVAVEPDRVQEVVSAAQRTELYFALPGGEVSGRTEGEREREGAL